MFTVTVPIKLHFKKLHSVIMEDYVESKTVLHKFIILIYINGYMIHLKDNKSVGTEEI